MKDLTGSVFNNYKVLGLSKKTTAKKIFWDCVCICGNKRAVSRSNLGKVRGCGCVRKTYEATGKYAKPKKAKRKPVKDFVIVPDHKRLVNTERKRTWSQIALCNARRRSEEIKEAQLLEKQLNWI